jgi:hypothetical protein
MYLLKKRTPVGSSTNSTSSTSQYSCVSDLPPMFKIIGMMHDGNDSYLSVDLWIPLKDKPRACLKT